ncbi:MAG TPA: hypothetical protein VMU42_02660 [Candidatus Sulfotelmatobacter sp.]|nr:hypothetical protein [Candidatus Sulfotelmatobacter sp.]
MHANWCKETTTTTGTGTLALSAVTGFPRFANHFIDGQPCSYAILDSTGAPVEAGIGHYVASNQIARDYATSTYIAGTLSEPASAFANLGTDNTNSPWTVIASPIGQSLLPAQPGFVSAAPNKYLVAPNYVNPGGGSAQTMVANTPWVTTFYMEYGREIAAFGVNVTTAAGTSSNKITIGLYPLRGDGSIAPALAISAAIDPSSTGFKTAGPASGGNFLVPPGWYLAAIASDVTCAISAFTAGAGQDFLGPSPFGINSSLQSIGRMLASTVTAGQLVSSLGTLSSPASINATFPPLIVLVAA